MIFVLCQGAYCGMFFGDEDDGAEIDAASDILSALRWFDDGQSTDKNDLIIQPVPNNAHALRVDDEPVDGLATR